VDDFKSIRVIREGENQVEVVHNPTLYPLIGKGKQGAVFKIASDKCVKIFADPNKVIREREAYKATEGSSIVPKLYEVGENYLVLEYIEGPNLQEYLASEGILTEEMTKKILYLLQEMKRYKFIRVDARLKHIYLTKEGVLKVIDHANSFKIKERPKRPELLMTRLNRLGLLSEFLEHVKHIDPDSYEEWKDFIGELNQSG
jgi:predicted Ser/Thr protein kinase